MICNVYLQIIQEWDFEYQVPILDDVDLSKKVKILGKCRILIPGKLLMDRKIIKSLFYAKKYTISYITYWT